MSHYGSLSSGLGADPQFAFPSGTIPVPVSPQAGEGLKELLLRATAENGLIKTIKLARYVAKDRIYDGMYWRANPEWETSPRSLARLLGADEGDLTRLFQEMVGAENVSFFGTSLPRSFIALNKRVSPRALQRRPYLRAMWRIRGIGFDNCTRERLIDSCPTCEKRFGFAMSFGICYCEHCAALRPFDRTSWTDLRDFPQQLVETHDEEALAYALALVDPEKPTGFDESRRLQDDLASFDRGELFELIVSLASLLAVHGSPSGRVKAQVGFNRSREPLPDASLAEAGRMVIDWPLSICRFADHLRGNPWGKNRAHPFTFMLRKLRGDSPIRKTLSNMALADRALRRGSTKLGAYPLRSEVMQAPCLRGRALLRDEWHSGWRSEGLPFVAYVNWREMYDLSQTRHDLGLFRERINGGEYGLRDGQTIGLFDAIHCLYPMIYGFPRWLLKSIIDGEIPITVSQLSTAPLLSRVRVDGPTFGRKLLGDHYPSGVGIDDLDFSDVEWLLRMPAQHIHRLKLGSAASTAPNDAEIREFRKRYIAPFEINWRLRRTGRPYSYKKLALELRQASIKAASGSPPVIYDRDTLESYFCLTARDVAACLCGQSGC